MFKGRYDYTVDEKGRASLPSRFRDTILSSGNDRVVITMALDVRHPHLDVHPAAAWSEFEQRLSARSLFDDNVVRLKRLYVANAVECPLDAHGRILIPAGQRVHANIGSDITWVGMTRIVEIWNPEIWAAAQKEAMEAVDQVRSGLSGLEL